MFWWSRFARASSGILNIAGAAGGCGCSVLADSADWDAPTWDMIPDRLPRLASTLQAIRQHTTAGFSFDPLWIGESPAEKWRTTFDELLRLVEQSRLGTKTRYLIEWEGATRRAAYLAGWTKPLRRTPDFRKSNCRTPN